MENKKAPSSFVPTLTEVVQPVAGHSGRPLAEATTHADSDANAIGAQDALVAELLHRLLPHVSSELQTALHESVDAHVQALLPRLAGHIEEAVRTALERAAEDGNAPKP
ncbi:hypothetical protein [Rhodoferax sp. OV413]|uniref:hypothetical protein n=1 Tax=Rhodoferax sp. OV413 TaxID=1855285 RepID=UPI0025FBA6AC|nr:hypothetical protein [Rhodoferax sp. OV413]